MGQRSQRSIIRLSRSNLGKATERDWLSHLRHRGVWCCPTWSIRVRILDFLVVCFLLGLAALAGTFVWTVFSEDAIVSKARAIQIFRGRTWPSLRARLARMQITLYLWGVTEGWINYIQAANDFHSFHYKVISGKLINQVTDQTFGDDALKAISFGFVCWVLSDGSSWIDIREQVFNKCIF